MNEKNNNNHNNERGSLGQEAARLNKVEQLLVSRGFDLNKLKNDTTVYKVKNMEQAAALIWQAVREGRHIHVVADYDADGVMSGCILYLILSEMGADFTIRFPKKMSEGYGISEKIVGEIPDGSLVLTIDNGIAAIEAIDIANSRDMDVVILDHHQIRGDGKLPNATCTVDPHIINDDGDFEHYCGAGLGYMLSKELKMPEDIINKANVLAAIATIQDVVPLVDDNRNIVKRGLGILNHQAVDLPGLYSLCSALKLMPSTNIKDCICEEDVNFKIGPCINAMGRMLDDGAKMAFEYLVHYDIHGEDGIREIIEWNEKRKDETAKQQDILDAMSSYVVNNDTTCAVFYAPGLHEGIIGINAARCVETYGVPAIVLTDSEHEGLLKGSARGIEGVNLKEALDKAAEWIYAYGGHAGAAGLTVEKAKLGEFVKAINAAMPKVTVDNTVHYDIEIDEKNIAAAYAALRAYAPYGEGFRAPIFKVKNYRLIKSYGKYYRYIGDNGVSLNGANSEAVTFTDKAKFKEIGSPLNMHVIGTLGYSRYGNKPQVMLMDMQAVNKNPDNGFLI